jgi:hypothetical protein
VFFTVDGVIQANDEIIMVDNEPLGDDDTIVAKLRGEDQIGSSCELVVKR